MAHLQLVLEVAWPDPALEGAGAKTLAMRYITKFASPDFWVDDPRKHGLIFVEFSGQVVEARPSHEFGKLRVPTLEWITKYRDAVLCILDDFETGEMCWVGLALNANYEPTGEDDTFYDYVNEYPYVRLDFSENWTLTTSDGEGVNRASLAHEDGTSAEFDRTTGAEKAIYTDGLSGHEIDLDSTSGEEKITVTHGPAGHKIELTNDDIIITHGATGAKITWAGSGTSMVVDCQDVTVNSDGTAMIIASGNVELDAGGAGGSVITTKSMCPYTGMTHIDGSSGVKATK